MNLQVLSALDAVSNPSRHVFITGRAGTGKSTLLRYLQETGDLGQTVVLAPTGVAAINVGGETLHRFFSLRPDMARRDVEKKAQEVAERPKASRIYRELETMIIDEVSMVRADLLDDVDAFLRVVRGKDVPFGGVRLIAFGDLFQLPPVVRPEEKELFTEHYESPYFFSSSVMRQLLDDEFLDNFALVELEKIYRQSDPDFIRLLNQVRSRTLDEGCLESINARVGTPPADQPVIYLTTTNRRASAINAEQLARLPGEEVDFYAAVSEEFPSSHYPTDEVLSLKTNARIMMLTNDPAGRWVNGSLGTIRGINQEENSLWVDLDDGELVTVEQHLWESSHSYWDGELGRIEKKSLGSFAQYPLRLAWAITIHKSQGKTFPHLVVDFERSAFAHGQAYVALSRATGLEGLWLARPMRAADVRLDYRVVRFLTQMHRKLSQRELPDNEAILERALEDQHDLQMTYLRSSTHKTTRRITPISVEWESFNGVDFLALKAFCHVRQAVRTFRVDQIVSLEPIADAQP